MSDSIQHSELHALAQLWAEYESEQHPDVPIPAVELARGYLGLIEQYEGLRASIRFCPNCAHGYEWQESDPVEGLCPGCRRAFRIEEETNGLKEQLEATQKALRELHEEMWTVRDNDGPEFVSSEGLKYLRGWFTRTDHLLGEASTATEVVDLDVGRKVCVYCGGDAHPAECGEPDPASEAMPGKGPKAGKPRNTDSGMAVRVGPLASEESSPAKRRGDTSEEEMRDWNAHIEESWLAEPDVSIPASRLPSMDDYPDAVPGGPVTHPASEPTRRELWDRKESTP